LAQHVAGQHVVERGGVDFDPRQFGVQRGGDEVVEAGGGRADQDNLIGQRGSRQRAIEEVGGAVARKGLGAVVEDKAALWIGWDGAVGEANGGDAIAAGGVDDLEAVGLLVETQRGEAEGGVDAVGAVGEEEWRAADDGVVVGRGVDQAGVGGGAAQRIDGQDKVACLRQVSGLWRAAFEIGTVVERVGVDLRGRGAAVSSGGSGVGRGSL
jgi:hypothetical protein